MITFILKGKWVYFKSLYTFLQWQYINVYECKNNIAAYKEKEQSDPPQSDQSTLDCTPCTKFKQLNEDCVIIVRS